MILSGVSVVCWWGDDVVETVCAIDGVARR